MVIYLVSVVTPLIESLIPWTLFKAYDMSSKNGSSTYIWSFGRSIVLWRMVVTTFVMLLCSLHWFHVKLLCLLKHYNMESSTPVYLVANAQKLLHITIERFSLHNFLSQHQSFPLPMPTKINIIQWLNNDNRIYKGLFWVISSTVWNPNVKDAHMS